MKKLGLFIRAFFSHTLFLINLGVAAWLLLCRYASTTDPADVRYLGIISLSTVFALIVNALFFVVWLFSRKKWRSLLSLAVLGICFRMIPAVFGLNYFEQNNMLPQLGGLKVLTWNVHGLGLYDRPVDKRRPEKMFALIEEQQPDVLCMLEFYTNNDGSNPKARKYFEHAGYKEYRFMYDNDLGAKIFIGNAIFSKYPLSNFKETLIDEYIKLMQCDVQLPHGQQVRLFVVHLQSFLLADKEKAMLEEAQKSAKKLEKQKAYTHTFLEKLNRAYQKRAPQAILTRAEIDKSPYPVVLCADLNDVPCSYTYTTIRGGLADAFAQKGKGLGRTYNMISPTLRIDYIFYSDSALKLIGYQSLKTPQFSDHNPVIANFVLK
ncbi:endonuclease/exonuclease/phosphatase family protein [Rurimicrobium arvi]|uniref:Endonuclease/exonuclease/phosphatase family protein n=1 Tax=Rurimicrobium arvi TaxID=2049916 RepID=A0ABP8MWG7_9BACT